MPMCNPVTTHSPESLLRKGIHLSLEWEVTNNGMGNRCGYVKVLHGHPWYGKQYTEIEENVEVHGGLTFSEPDTQCGRGLADDGWWLGFDAGHHFDLSDPSLPRHGGVPLGLLGLLTSFCDTDQAPPSGNPAIRDTDYMEAQCRSLCEQAAAFASPRG